MITWFVSAFILGVFCLPFIPEGWRSRRATAAADADALRHWEKLRRRGFAFYVFVEKAGIFIPMMAIAAMCEAHRATASYIPNGERVRVYGSMAVVLTVLSGVADWTAHKNRAQEAAERIKKGGAEIV